MAVLYADAGFAVVIDDVVREADMLDFLPHLDGRPITKVLLSPRLEVALERNRTRTNKMFEPKILTPSAAKLHASLLEGCRPEDGWIVVDTSELDAEAVANEILGRSGPG